MQDRLQVTSVGYSPFRYVGRGGSVVECLPSGGSQIRRLVRALLSSSRGGALCLVFSSTFLDPRVGRFMDKSTPLSSVSLSLVFFSRSSNGIQVHSSMHVVHPSHPWFPLFSCSRCSALHDFFRQSPSFLITCPKYDNFLLLIILSSPRSIPAVSIGPTNLRHERMNNIRRVVQYNTYSKCLVLN